MTFGCSLKKKLLSPAAHRVCKKKANWAVSDASLGWDLLHEGRLSAVSVDHGLEVVLSGIAAGQFDRLAEHTQRSEHASD